MRKVEVEPSSLNGFGPGTLAICEHLQQPVSPVCTDVAPLGPGLRRGERYLASVLARDLGEGAPEGVAPHRGEQQREQTWGLPVGVASPRHHHGQGPSGSNRGGSCSHRCAGMRAAVFGGEGPRAGGRLGAGLHALRHP